MSITSCIELDLEGARTFRIALADGTTCRRSFRVLSDSSADTETSVFSGAQSSSPNALPAPLSLFPGSTIAYCYQYDIVRDKSATNAWLVSVDYKTIFNQNELDRNSDQDPTARPTRISGVSRSLFVPVRFMLRSPAYTTWNPNAAFTMCTAANSATDPLDPPVDQPATEWELHCEKHVPYLPAWFGASSGYSDGVNASDQNITVQGQVFNMLAGSAKLSNFTFSDHKQENGVSFITIGWNVTLRKSRQPIGGEQSVPGPWDVERLDEGMRTRKQVAATSTAAASAIWENVKDKAGTTVMTPVPFNGRGKPISDPGIAIPENKLNKFCYRPCGSRVDFSVIPWR